MKDAVRYVGALVALLFVVFMFAIWLSKRPDDSGFVRCIGTLIVYLLILWLGLGILSMFL